MSSEWKTYSVEELVTSGILAPPLDGNHGAIHPKASDFVSSGIPFIMASDMMNGVVDTINCAFITKEQALSLRKGFAKSGDVLLSHKATIGRTALVGKIETEYLVLTPQVTYYRVTDYAHLNNRYLKYYFDSAPFQQILGAWAGAGSTRAYLGITAQRKLPIVVPPVSLQNDIAEIIGALDDRITLLRETNATLEAISQAIFKSWFVDFDPVHAKQQGRAPEGMDETTAALFPDSFEESKLGLVPKGWRVSTVGQEITTVDYVANGSFASLKENVTLRMESSYALYVRTTDHNSGFKGDFRYVDKPAFDFLSKSSLTASDVVISNVGDVGTVFRPPKWLGMPMTLGSNAIALKNPKLSGFMFYFFKSAMGQHLIHSIVTGSAQLKFNKTNFRSLPFVVPIDRVLLKFEEIVGSLLEKVDENTAQAQTLATIRDTLLPRLISGQLRLPEAESLIAEAIV